MKQLVRLLTAVGLLGCLAVLAGSAEPAAPAPMVRVDCDDMTDRYLCDDEGS